MKNSFMNDDEKPLLPEHWGGCSSASRTLVEISSHRDTGGDFFSFFFFKSNGEDLPQEDLRGILLLGHR